jgi:sulfate adenylyltransferase subunit 2
MQVMRTEALKQALDKWGFDAALGGAQRGEESGKGTRVFLTFGGSRMGSAQPASGALEPVQHTKISKGTIRVFALWNWTELDIRQYTKAEGIPVVPLYFAAPRPVVQRDGLLVMRDDDRMPLRPGEAEEIRMVPFRSLGCYPRSRARRRRSMTSSMRCSPRAHPSVPGV